MREGFVRRWAAPTRVPVIVLVVAGLVQTCLAIYFLRGGFLGVDGLMYVTRRGTVPGESVGLFAPSGGHWQTVPILVYRAIFAVVGLRHYLPFALTAVCFHLVICGLMYAILVRLGTRRWVAVAVTLLLMFYGGGAEAYLSDAPMALTLSLALGLTTIYVCLVRDFDRAALIAGALMLLLAVMSSVTGLVAGAFVGVFIWFRRGILPALAVGALPVICFGVWFATSGRTGGRVNVHGWDFVRLPDFIWTGLTGPLGNSLGIPEVGGVLLLVVIASTFLVRGTPPVMRQFAWAGIIAALSQMVLSALANLQVGNQQALVGRYQYLVLVCMLPAVAISLDALVSWAPLEVRRISRPALVLIAGFVALLALVHSIGLQHGQSQFFQAQSRNYRAWTLGTVAAVNAGERLLTVSLDDPFAHADDMALFARPSMRSALPDKPATPEQRLAAEGDSFVGVGARSYGLPPPTAMESTSFQQPILDGTGCVTLVSRELAPSMTLDSGPGAEITVTSQSSKVVTRLVRDGVASDTRDWHVVPGTAVHIGVSAKDATLAVLFDAGGTYELCRGTSGS